MGLNKSGNCCYLKTIQFIYFLCPGLRQQHQTTGNIGCSPQKHARQTTEDGFPDCLMLNWGLKFLCGTHFIILHPRAVTMESGTHKHNCQSGAVVRDLIFGLEETSLTMPTIKPERYLYPQRNTLRCVQTYQTDSQIIVYEYLKFSSKQKGVYHLARADCLN